MNSPFSRRERQLQRILLRFVGVPYQFGGRGMSGIDCSSLLVRAIRETVRRTVGELPWMTADQIARGHREITIQANLPITSEACRLVFFDWDEDQNYEHCAARLCDGSWIWASTSAGQVIHVDPQYDTVWDQQWREIEGALGGKICTHRFVNWSGLEK